MKTQCSVISTVPFCPVMFTACYCHAGAPGAAVKQLWIHFTLCKSLFSHLSGLPEPEDTKLSVGSPIHCMSSHPRVWEIWILNKLNILEITFCCK